MDIKELNPQIKTIYSLITGKNAYTVTRLPLAGSNRLYFRIEGEAGNLIATYNEDKDENRAFLYLAAHLLKAGVPVPEIRYSDIDNNIYFQEDLGDTCLFDLATDAELSDEEKFYAFKKVIDKMPAFQYEAAKELDFSICYPRKAFDKQSIQWDLNYFKYLFLKLSQVPFSEQKLEDEFNKLTDFALEAPADFFLFRDFKSKNIMWKEDNPVFIDFQGGRKGALQYDLASLLFESKANLSAKLRDKLLNYYTEVFSEYSFFNKDQFLKYYPVYVLIRLLQVFGAYGYRGLYEKKAYFIHSIVPGIENLLWVKQQNIIQKEFPYICDIIEQLDNIKAKYRFEETGNDLTVTITSFSYRNGIPEDLSGNGGGFVFDCRLLHNPGRYEEYKLFTGIDKEIYDFFSKDQEVTDFLSRVQHIVGQAVKKYQSRKFSHLSVSLGCTGGRHRSVYTATKIFEYLRLNFNVNLRLKHRELNLEERYDKIDV